MTHTSQPSVATKSKSYAAYGRSLYSVAAGPRSVAREASPRPHAGAQESNADRRLEQIGRPAGDRIESGVAHLLELGDRLEQRLRTTKCIPQNRAVAQHYPPKSGCYYLEYSSTAL